MRQDNEVALFIDFENIRYGLLNDYNQEPDPQALMAKARAYGRVVVANAYADYTEHPPNCRRDLEVAGIRHQDVSKRNGDGNDKQSADMAMLMDIIDCLLDRPSIDTYVLMTGDSDFIRVVTRACHRFGKKVIISGIPGTVSRDLVVSANAEDPLSGDDMDVPPLSNGRAQATQGTTGLPPSSDILTEEETELIRLIDRMEQRRPELTLGYVRSYTTSPKCRLQLSEGELTRLLSRFIASGILIADDKQLDNGRLETEVLLNHDHEWCQRVLDGARQQR
ncbi:MAG: NYN domain-containing protein [Candidatus Binatia bacterium]